MQRPREEAPFYPARRRSCSAMALAAGSGWVPAPHLGTHASNGIGAASAGSLVESLVEAVSPVSDLSTRRAHSPLWGMASQILRSVLLDCRCTLDWAQHAADQYGTNASNLVTSRMNQFAAALVTASCRSMMRHALSGDTPAMARFTANGPGYGRAWMIRGR